MAARIVEHAEGLEYLCDESQIDPIRNHARRGTTPNLPVHTRRIYAANARMLRDSGALEQVIHESDFLVTPWDEWYFVQIIFGQEFAINLGGPEIDGYLKWLKNNNDESWLYMAKNVGLYPKPKRADTA
jgi:hypothetical protein